MKRRWTIGVLCFGMILSLVGCSLRYDANDFIGKTSADIIREYGVFDCTLLPASADGLYRNCECGYIETEARVGFLGLSAEVLFFIVFDENGIAIDCERGYRPGG